MSNPGEKSGSEKIVELLEITDRIDEIVKSANKTPQSPTKMKITLNSHLNQLTGSVNKFFADRTHTTEQKLLTTIQLIEVLNEILVYIPRKGELYLTWLNYASMANFVRRNLAFIHHESDLGKSLSTAGALSQLLLGEIQHIEEIPEMPPLSDPVRYFEYFIPLFNAIQSTIGVYHMLIDSLAVINYNDFVDWTNEAIWHYKMLWELCETLNIKVLLNTRKIKNVKNFYNNTLTLGSTIASSSYLLATVFEKVTTFPDEIDDQGLLPERTLQGLIQHLNKILSYFDKIEQDIEECYNNFVVNRNDKLEESDYYDNFKLIQSDIVMAIDLLQFDQDQATDDLELLDKIINRFENLLKDIIDQAGGIEAALESYMLSSVMGVLKDTLPFIAMKSVVVQNPSVLEDYLFSNRKALRKADLAEFAEFHFIKVLCITHVYSRLDPSQIELVDHFQELNMIKESFTLKPRLYVAANLFLMQLVELGIGLADISQFEYNVRETIQQNYPFSTYAQDVEVYLMYLKNRDHIDVSSLYYRREHVPFDPFSWIFPDWSEISNVEYIPFSRLKDSVLRIQEN